MIEFPLVSMALDMPMSIYVDRLTRYHPLLVDVGIEDETPMCAVARVGASGGSRIRIDGFDLTHAMISELVRHVVWDLVCSSMDIEACREDARMHGIPSA